MPDSTGLTKEDLRVFSKYLTSILISADNNAIELYREGKISRSEKLALDKQRDALEDALREVQRAIGNRLLNQLLDTNKSSPLTIL